MSQETPSGTEKTVLSMDEIGEYLIAKMKPLLKARIVFSGFDLPEEFGGSQEFEFGNIAALNAAGIGLGPAGENTDRIVQNAALMGKEFVMQAIEDLFIDDLEELFSPESLFTLEQKGEVFIVTATEEAA